MLQKMANILVVGPKQDYSEIVDALYQTGTIHLEEVTDRYPWVSSSRLGDFHQSEEIKSLLMKIGGILNILPSLSPGKGAPPHYLEDLRHKTTNEIITKAAGICNSLDSSIRTFETRKGELELKSVSLSRYEKVFLKVFPLERQLPRLEGFEVTILIIQKEYEEVLDTIKSFFSGITRNQFELISEDLDEKNLAVITVFNKKYSERVHEYLYSKNINEVRIPVEYSNMSLDQALILLEKDRQRANAEIEEIQERFAILSAQWYQELDALQTALGDRQNEIDAYSKFGETAYTVFIKGWIPKKHLKRVKKTLHDGFGDRVVLMVLPVTPEMLDNAPVFYDNPFWIRPFEFFMQLVGLPQYREVDPTIIIAISFPFFFGLIVGDIGYGLVIILAALALRIKFGSILWIRQVSSILIISCIPTIIFGYLFGEFFGDFGEMMGWLHPVHLFGITWNRMEAIIPLLALAIGIGAVHVFLGLFIGAYNAAIRKKRRHLCEKCGMIGVLAAIIVLLGSATALLSNIFFLPSVIILIISLVFLVYGGGALGAIEIMGTLGNIMSYARLMAIGMASVILAIVANRLGTEMGFVVLGVLVAVLLHILNIGLAMFSPSIHSMRLHIVEFFSKFYEGGGEPYLPFGKNKME